MHGHLLPFLQCLELSTCKIVPLFGSAKLHYVIWRGFYSSLQTWCSFLGDNSGFWIYRWIEMAKSKNNLDCNFREPRDFQSALFLGCCTCHTEHLQYHVWARHRQLGGSSTAAWVQTLHHLELDELVSIAGAWKPGPICPGCSSFFALCWCSSEEDKTHFCMTDLGTASVTYL